MAPKRGRKPASTPNSIVTIGKSDFDIIKKNNIIYTRKDGVQMVLPYKAAHVTKRVSEKCSTFLDRLDQNNVDVLEGLSRNYEGFDPERASSIHDLRYCSLPEQLYRKIRDNATFTAEEKDFISNMYYNVLPIYIPVVFCKAPNKVADASKEQKKCNQIFHPTHWNC